MGGLVTFLDDHEKAEDAMTCFADFIACDRAAVKIDWIAVSAGVLLAGIVAFYLVFTGDQVSSQGPETSRAEGPTFHVASENAGKLPE
jgi:hypothetical protein